MDVQKDIFLSARTRDKMFADKAIEGKHDEPIFAASEDEVLELEHLLSEPKCKDSLDNILGLKVFTAQMNFTIEDSTTCVNFDQQKPLTDKLDSNSTQEEKTRQECLGGVSAEDIGAECILSTSTDLLFNTDNSHRVHNLKYGTSGEACLRGIGLGSRPTFDEDDYGSEILKLSAARVPELESTSVLDLPLLENMTIQELHEAFRSSFKHENSKLSLKQHIAFEFGNHDERENSSNLAGCCTMANKSGDNMFLSSGNDSFRKRSRLSTDISSSKLLSNGDPYGKVERFVGCNSLKAFTFDAIGDSDISDSGGKDVLFTEKRLRKRPQRYIEELVEQNLRHRKCGKSPKSSRERILHVRLQKQHGQKAISETQSTFWEESATGPCIQVPFGVPLPVEKGRHKKKSSFLVHEPEQQNDSRLFHERSDLETICAVSQDEKSDDESIARLNMATVRSRRKNHKLWTLSEVMKLIEGVSQFGVGKWTEIKRLLFSSSADRTSVDLKDKWRNLLKASCMKLQTKREVEQGRKHASNQMPQGVLHRVRELAHMHPYPSKRKVKDSLSAPVAPSHAASSGNMVPLETAVKSVACP